MKQFGTTHKYPPPLSLFLTHKHIYTYVHTNKHVYISLFLVCITNTHTHTDKVDEYDNDLMGDEADRQRLASMTEMDRENELFSRAEERQKRMDVLQAKRRIKAKKRVMNEWINKYYK